MFKFVSGHRKVIVQINSDTEEWLHSENNMKQKVKEPCYVIFLSIWNIENLPYLIEYNIRRGKEYVGGLVAHFVVKQSICSAQIIVNSGAPTIGSTGAAQWKLTQDLLVQREEEKKIFLKYRKPTHNITWFYCLNRSCVRSREKGRNFIEIWGSIRIITSTSQWEDYKPLMATKNNEPLWLSFSHESLTLRNYTLRNHKFIGLHWRLP